MPYGQFTGAFAASKHDWPAGQGWHEKFPPVEYVPFPHGTGGDFVEGHV